ncbi:MAG: transposase [Candidatus Omnitrophota bacterium]
MKTIKFSNNAFYHIYNRGVDKRQVFYEDKDYLRLIHSLYEFNDKRSALPHYKTSSEALFQRGSSRELLVHIICFCLMGNHFHLVLEQLTDGGITKFMRKLGTGYTLYFNKKHERNGVLFQGQFKAIRIEREEYLLHLSRYIHLNPVDILEPNWKREGIKNWYAIRSFLNRYRWSSFIDYTGGKNFPSLIKESILNTYFNEPAQYQKFIERFLGPEISKIEDILLES